MEYMCWFQGVYELTKVVLRSYPKIGHRVGKIQDWSRLSQWIKLINSQSVEDVPRGIKWSHGMVSIVHCALCTNPWSMWEFYVGLGTCSWACVKRKISLNPWRGWHQVVIVIKIAVCKFKWSITKRSSAWSLPSIVVTMDLWRCAEEWLTHSGLWGSNHLVFIEPTQSRKVVQLEEVKIVIIQLKWTMCKANVFPW